MFTAPHSRDLSRSTCVKRNRLSVHAERMVELRKDRNMNQRIHQRSEQDFQKEVLNRVLKQGNNNKQLLMYSLATFEVSDSTRRTNYCRKPPLYRSKLCFPFNPISLTPKAHPFSMAFPCFHIELAGALPISDTPFLQSFHIPLSCCLALRHFVCTALKILRNSRSSLPALYWSSQRSYHTPS